MSTSTHKEQVNEQRRAQHRPTSSPHPSRSSATQSTDVHESPENTKSRNYQPVKRDWAEPSKANEGSDEKYSSPIARWQMGNARDQPWNALGGIYTETRLGNTRGGSVSKKDKLSSESVLGTHGSASGR